MKSSQVVFQNKLPTYKSFKGPCFLIYDSYFETNSPSLKPIQEWIHSFPNRIGFASGEDLKNLSHFPERIEKILSLVSEMAVKNVQIIGLGGGSIGDFAGFVASILRRGLPLIHIPTTWLSAMDSSHGGKTALNVAGFKNQIGTFYPADKIILVKPLLFEQPAARAEEAFGEALKMALLKGGDLWKSFSKIKKFDHATAWKFLPALIEGKYQIVKKDPYEKKGLRHLLNLGHTLGHVWEAALGIPHGTAVSYGLRACIEISREKKVLSEKEYRLLNEAPVIAILPSKEDLAHLMNKSSLNVKEYLLKDKKISQSNSLRYIFIQRPGKCPIADLKIDELVAMYEKLR